jgi:glycosyltransferase involved in cell wall biosynthesis
MMRVVQVNSADIVGRRFNGYDARTYLAAEGIHSNHLVWTRTGTDPSVVKLFDVRGIRLATRLATRAVSQVERRLSIHSLLQLQSFALPLHKTFRHADLVHYQIVHDGFFSLWALPWLSRLKPSIWTWHDPFIMTGHCIYPLNCERWRIGCGCCPALDLPFAFRRDRTAFGFRQKKWVCSHAELDVVVASRHMLEMARQSPIAQTARLHLIPFGIDLDRFCPRDSAGARERLGVLGDRAVIFVRAFESPFKGFDYLLEALERLSEASLCIITTHHKGLLNRFVGRHQIIELGWVDDEDRLIEAYTAADFFVMPSTAEAFGMMAIEAMACGKPVIVFDGTSLPEVTFAPAAGLSVPMRDGVALAAAILRLATDPDERRRRGETSRQLAQQHYDIRLHAKRMADLYRSVAGRHREGRALNVGSA